MARDQSTQGSKKERFLDVALRLIHKKGFKATTMRDIAGELNFEVANVYNYIDSKQALLEEYLFDIQREFHEAIDPIVHSNDEAHDKLRLAITSYVRIATKRPYVQALLVNEWRNLKAPRRQEFIERRAAYEQKVQALIEAGIASGRFRKLDPEMATQTILATLRWLHQQYLDAVPALSPVEMEKQLLAFISHGIEK